MPKNIAAIFGCLFALTAGYAWANSPSTSILGDYVEIRSCDVFTGPCFANGEMGLAGEEAILTWSIREGIWNGIPLSGLSVLAVLKARTTLGDIEHDPVPAKALLVVDSQADASQRQALLQFARQMAGSLLDDVVGVEASAIDVTVNPSTCPTSGCSTIRADGLVEVQTRCLNGEDHVCGNEACFYPPLTKVNNVRPAYTMVGRFQGQGLGLTFNEADRRSAYLATFEH